MKTKRQTPIILLALLIGACSTVPTGSDPTVVNAEKLIAIEKATAQFAVDTESQSRAALIQINYNAAISIKHAVDKIRATEPTIRITAVNSVKAYKANASKDGYNAVQKALADISDILMQAQTALSNINKAKTGAP